ncbi:MAG: methyltransferase domain-containing protein [Candidatus Binatia bacterium]
MSTETAMDPTRVEAFFGKMITDLGGLSAGVMTVLGDRLGRFRSLAESGPATSEELARRTGLNERYVREWLGGMRACRYLEHDPQTRRFALPPEHAAILAEEGGPLFFCGFPQMLIDTVTTVLDTVTKAFREGGGMPQSGYGKEFWAGLERLTRGWYDNMLVQEWVPALPGLKDALERGAAVADLGCGAGRALIRLAGAFPRSRFVGYDVFPPSIERARANANEMGVADRVRFEVADVVRGLPERYDVVTTFEVIHDAADPLAILRAIRRGLDPGGLYLCLDVNCSDKLEENADPLGAMLYGASLLYCMTTSLANGGVGLGTLGCHEKKLGELCAEAGFASVRRVPVANPFQNLRLPFALYEVRP